MEDGRGQPVALSSGFFVKEKVIASNFHVVEKAARGYAKLVGQKSKYNIAGVVGLDSKHDPGFARRGGRTCAIFEAR